MNQEPELVKAINVKTSVPDAETVGKIFAKKDNGIEFLSRYYKEKFSTKYLVKLTAKKTYELISENWNYEYALEFTRKKFLSSEKAKRGKEGYHNMVLKIQQWKKHHDIKELDWPFGAGPSGFDDSIMEIIRDYKDEDEKIKVAQDDIEKHIYMKEISTFRNDYIEYLIVSRYDFVMPTLGDRKEGDFCFDGIMYDQKISRSVGKDFKMKYENWEKTALEHPELVAQSLYENQGSARFGANARFLIVFVNTEFSEEQLIEKLDNFDFSKPYEITFKYGKEWYKTECLCLII